MGVLFQNKLTLSDASLFEEFFKKNYQLCCLVALRYVKSEQIADDIVQEAFVTLWQKRHELRIQTSLKNYLLNMVKNRSLNYLRDETQMDEITESSLSSDLIDDPNDNFSQEELALHIAKAIDELPSQCKKVFQLAYHERLTYNEIASTLNLSRNTIKTQMGIAYKMIRFKLSDYFLNLFSFSFFRTKK
ncbi:RNA polymerase sigma-70 factor [Mangrovibacterium lignilyticum]|uniref:RNA polymerase sigma-70 factor n=1 Tax=Mangrovibacterium lignilyticum TaxID=2668052 RepID=UPI0013D100BB|nr:RNA polymerase sigma-70 factor [Mangrovibacterium lignilyticum]